MRAETGGFANEAYLSNATVSSKQQLGDLKTTNYSILNKISE